MLLEPLPLLGLGGEEEVEDIVGEHAEVAVVVVLAAPPVEATRKRVVAERRGWLAHLSCIVRVGVGSTLEEGSLDRLFERALGDLRSHVGRLR